MNEPVPPRFGLLVIRALVEDEGGGRLIARITRTIDVAREQPVTSVASDVEDLCSIIRGWLEAILSS